MNRRQMLLASIACPAIPACGCLSRPSPTVLCDCLGTVFDIYGQLRQKVGDVEGLRWLYEYVSDVERIGSGELPWATCEEVIARTLPRAIPRLTGSPEWLLKLWTTAPAHADAVTGIRMLCERGVRCVAWTNASRKMIASLSSRAGITWDAVRCSTDWQTYKPNPRIYSEAGDSLPAPTWIVTSNGNGPDVVLGRRVGFTPVVVDRTGHPGVGERGRVSAPVQAGGSASHPGADAAGFAAQVHVRAITDLVEIVR